MSTSVIEVVNRQILRWQKQGEVSRRQLTEKLGSKPMIAISSAYGSRGWKIGQAVAEQLGFDFFDRELVERIAAAANVRQKLVESLDERAQDWITEYISKQFETEVFTASDFLRHLSRVMLAISQHGRAVVMGRGSQFILKPDTTLRVRTIAPLPHRIRWIAEEEGIDEPEARAVVLRRDSERAAFSLLHFNHNVTDAEHYDVVLNTAVLPLAAAAEIVVRTYQLRFAEPPA